MVWLFSILLMLGVGGCWLQNTFEKGVIHDIAEEAMEQRGEILRESNELVKEDMSKEEKVRYWCGRLKTDRTLKNKRKCKEATLSLGER